MTKAGRAAFGHPHPASPAAMPLSPVQGEGFGYSPYSNSITRSSKVSEGFSAKLTAYPSTFPRSATR